ncbi:hypothetical protein J2X72_003147 [Phyllobacterium sp. 1468]|uniref:hypothetical protein n=1 Tax=Phyllobacterium sp. 1468 TaxID=2817759 RepID=UPI002862A09D|nr:hypothetical protein [Phyllobacterium sp. 1468]MDR6634337.1 hypothetical protein [Phyllobacterium sp. 1468]
MPFHGRSRSPKDLEQIRPAHWSNRISFKMRIIRPAGLKAGWFAKQTNGRVSGWRTTTLSGGVGRWKHVNLATFRVDCLAIRETELALNKQNLLCIPSE